MTSLAREESYGTVVDIATGPGFTGFAMTPFARRVIACDPAVGMLQQARGMAAERACGAFHLVLSVAEAFPMASESADLITCRTAPHHFQSIPAFLAEAARVLRPGGALILADTSAPEEPALDAWMNDVELRRDPTHVRDLTHAEWREAIASAGLALDYSGTTRVYMQVLDWVARSGLDGDAKDDVLRMWREAPLAAKERFQITLIPGPGENYRFAWPVFVGRARKPG